MKNFYSIFKTPGLAKTGLRSLLAVFILLCGINNAMALGVCSYIASPVIKTVNRDFTVQQDAPVGSSLSTVSWTMQYKIAESCTGEYLTADAFNKSVFPSVNSSTVSSGVPGIGIRVKINGTSLSTGAPSMGGGTSYNSDPIYIQGIEVEFVKTGDVVPGTVTSGKLANVLLEDKTGTQEVLVVNIGTVNVKQASCDITGSSAIPVPMGNVMLEDFNGKNSTLPPTEITIPLQCSADTRVNISFDAQSSLGNGIIDLAKGGAEGVGIQLKYKDTPVEFNKAIFVATATQQGVFNIPLTAAYIQTENTINTGVANAVANFTVTYE